jgi:hypothetical protein
MINKYLMVTLSEDIPVGGEIDAMSLMTKSDGGVTINVPSQKLAISMHDLQDALKELQAFVAGLPVKASEKKESPTTVGSDGTMHNFEFSDKE